MLSANVDLVSNNGGNADLYIMDCENRASCFIDSKMISNAQNLSQNPNKFFKFSKDSNYYDSIAFEMMIKPTEAQAAPDTNYSKNNMFAVAVVGNSINTDPESQVFFLRFSTSGYERLLLENEQRRLIVPVGSTKMIEFTSIRPVDNIRELIFNFKIFSGDLTVYFKKGSKPTQTDDF